MNKISMFYIIEPERKREKVAAFLSLQTKEKYISDVVCVRSSCDIYAYVGICTKDRSFIKHAYVVYVYKAKKNMFFCVSSPHVLHLLTLYGPNKKEIPWSKFGMRKFNELYN